MPWSYALAEHHRQADITLPTNEAVLFGTTIGNIFHPAPPDVRYEIGDPQTRGDVMKGIAQVLETDVLRALDLIESLGALRAAVDAVCYDLAYPLESAL